MRSFVFALIVVLVALIPVVHATIDERIAVTAHANNSVTEQVTLAILTTEALTSVSYPLNTIPSSVSFAGNYTLTNDSLIVYQQIRPGSNTVSFTLTYDYAVHATGPLYRYGNSFKPITGAGLTVSFTLPAGYVLANLTPAVSPVPSTLSSDGQSITVVWKGGSALNAVVFYQSYATLNSSTIPTESESSSRTWTKPFSFLLSLPGLLILGLLMLALMAHGFGLFSKRKNHSHLMDTLGDDERLIVEFIRHGFHSQKKIATEAGFSKSKMSKVVRKLEEKKVIRKEPHFKTNRLELLPGWR